MLSKAFHLLFKAWDLICPHWSKFLPAPIRTAPLALGASLWVQAVGLLFGKNKCHIITPVVLSVQKIPEWNRLWETPQYPQTKVEFVFVLLTYDKSTSHRPKDNKVSKSYSVSLYSSVSSCFWIMWRTILYITSICIQSGLLIQEMWYFHLPFTSIFFFFVKQVELLVLIPDAVSCQL